MLLDELRDRELLLHALPLAGLGLLLADELGHAQRGSSLAGKVVQQASVVGGVFLL